MSFKEQLIRLRKQRGLSQEQLGQHIGVSRQTVSKWELGDTTPELEKLIQISRFFDISIDTLVGNEDEKNAASQESKTGKSERTGSLEKSAVFASTASRAQEKKQNLLLSTGTTNTKARKKSAAFR